MNKKKALDKDLERDARIAVFAASGRLARYDTGLPVACAIARNADEIAHAILAVLRGRYSIQRKRIR